MANLDFRKLRVILKARSHLSLAELSAERLQ